MTQVYTRNGSLPGPLPFRIALSDGRSRTDPASFTPEEIADAGYVSASPRPEPSPDQVVSWGGADWVIRAKTTEELAAEAAAARARLHKNLADYRWGVETGGVDLAGSQIETTREAQAQISSTYSALKNGLVTSVEWKAATGWLVLDLSAFTPIAQAVATHVQACFAAERAVSTQIDALTDAELPGFNVVAAFDAAKT